MSDLHFAMMRRRLLRRVGQIVVVVVLFAGLGVIHAGAGDGAGSAPDPYRLLVRFREATTSFRYLSYHFIKKERMADGSMRHEEAKVKLRHDGAVYIAAHYPKAGQEVIYNPRLNRQELVVHPGSFPDLTLWLDIHGSMTTDGQHHPVNRSGYRYLVQRVFENLEHLKEGHGDLRYVGRETFQGEQVHIVDYRCTLSGGRRVKAKADMPLLAFAEQVGQDAYVIAHNNPGLSALSDEVEEGETYFVPYRYASRIELHLSAKSHLARKIQIWDDKGKIYEVFEFRDLRVNPPLGKADFDPENKAYNF